MNKERISKLLRHAGRIAMAALILSGLMRLLVALINLAGFDLEPGRVIVNGIVVAIVLEILEARRNKRPSLVLGE